MAETVSEQLSDLKSIKKCAREVKSKILEKYANDPNFTQLPQRISNYRKEFPERKKVYKYSKYWSYKKMLKTWNDQLVEPDIFDFIKFFVSRGDLVDMAEKLIFHDFRDFLPSDSVRLVRDRSSSLK